MDINYEDTNYEDNIEIISETTNNPQQSVSELFHLKNKQLERKFLIKISLHK